MICDQEVCVCVEGSSSQCQLHQTGSMNTRVHLRSRNVSCQPNMSSAPHLDVCGSSEKPLEALAMVQTNETTDWMELEVAQVAALREDMRAMREDCEEQRLWIAAEMAQIRCEIGRVSQMDASVPKSADTVPLSHDMEDLVSQTQHAHAGLQSLRALVHGLTDDICGQREDPGFGTELSGVAENHEGCRLQSEQYGRRARTSLPVGCEDT